MTRPGTDPQFDGVAENLLEAVNAQKPSGGEASMDTLFLNTSKANRKKHRNPSAFDAINPPAPWSERDVELENDLAAMGIEGHPRKAPPARRTRNSTRDSSKEPPARPTSAASASTTTTSHRPPAWYSGRHPRDEELLAGSALSDVRSEPLPHGAPAENVGNLAGTSIVKPAQTNLFPAEEALIEKALRRLPRAKYDRDDNVVGLAELIGGMKQRCRILDTFDEDVLAATAQPDAEGKDVRDHREKDIELAQAWHPVMQNNMKGFFEEHPAVNSKAWKQRKQKEKMAIARAAKEKQAAAKAEEARKAAQSEEPLVSTEPVPEQTEPLEETATPAGKKRAVAFKTPTLETIIADKLGDTEMADAVARNRVVHHRISPTSIGSHRLGHTSYEDGEDEVSTQIPKSPGRKSSWKSDEETIQRPRSFEKSVNETTRNSNGAERNTAGSQESNSVDGNSKHKSDNRISANVTKTYAGRRSLLPDPADEPVSPETVTKRSSSEFSENSEEESSIAKRLRSASISVRQSQSPRGSKSFDIGDPESSGSDTSPRRSQDGLPQSQLGIPNYAAAATTASGIAKGSQRDENSHEVVTAAESHSPEEQDSGLPLAAILFSSDRTTPENNTNGLEQSDLTASTASEPIKSLHALRSTAPALTSTKLPVPEPSSSLSGYITSNNDKAPDNQAKNLFSDNGATLNYTADNAVNEPQPQLSPTQNASEADTAIDRSTDLASMLFPSNSASPEPTAANIPDKRRLDPSITHTALSTADSPVDINADRFGSSNPPFSSSSSAPEGSHQLAIDIQEPDSNDPDTDNNWADAAINAAAEAIDSHKVEIPDGVQEPSTESGWEQMRDGMELPDFTFVAAADADRLAGNPPGVEAEVAGDSDTVMEAPGTEGGGDSATTAHVDTGVEGMSGDGESSTHRTTAWLDQQARAEGLPRRNPRVLEGSEDSPIALDSDEEDGGVASPSIDVALKPSLTSVLVKAESHGDKMDLDTPSSYTRDAAEGFVHVPIPGTGSSDSPFILVDDDEERSIEIAPFTKPTATLAASPVHTPNEPVAQRTRPAEPSKPNIEATRANQQPPDLEMATVHNPFDEIYGPGSGLNATGDPVGALKAVMARYRLNHDTLPAGVRRAVEYGSNVESRGTDKAARDPAHAPVVSRPELKLDPYEGPVAALKAAIASNQPSPTEDLRRVQSSRRAELIRASRRSEGGKVGNQPVGVPSAGSSASTWPGLDPYTDPAAELKAATARNCHDSDGPSNGIRGTVTFRPTHVAAGLSGNDQSEVGSLLLEHTAMTTAPTVEVAETEHDDQSQVSSSMKRKCNSNASQSIAVEADRTPVTPGEMFEAEGSPGMSHVIGDGSADSPVMLDSDDEGDGDGGGPKSNPASA
ncbi:hypothetical protein SLS56_008296 [Neofusicoccum ribis]|uniref:Uncharacterized protein n=1 Tax=Neofusicoccum ribis TaxID=45134 RepID=A0ABR3SL42_9PEZI